MKRIFELFLYLGLLSVAVTSPADIAVTGGTASELGSASMVDPDATKETRALFENLLRFSDQKLMFGHQHTTCYGIGWAGGDTDRSDVKTLVGSHAAVYGWDMGHTGTDRMDRLIIDAFERGGVNTISWHMENLVTGGKYNDAQPGSVAAVLPGGRFHQKLKRELDIFADFASSLKDSKGRLVPIIFRPWHEHTGGWFWWGSRSCTADEFISLWRYTVSYLRDVRKVHNLLYAFSPSGQFFSSRQAYLENRFPGFEYVDIVGFDHYVNAGRLHEIAERAAIVTRLAREHQKVAALTEFGYREGLSHCDNPDWFMDFLRTMKSTDDALGIAYALTWRNGSKEHFWVPYAGHSNEQDFRRFFMDEATVFEKSLPDLYKQQEGLFTAVR